MQEENLPLLEHVDLDSEAYVGRQDTPEDKYALALVNQAFSTYEIFRTNNHDRRWNTHDELYFGWLAPRVWKGSNVPRSALAQQLVYDQVESLVPAITQALFNTGPEWFQVSAEKETTPEEAQQVQDGMSYYLEHPNSDFGVNAVGELELAIRSAALYGNGGVGLEWDAVDDRPKIEWVDIRDFYIDPACPTPNVDECRSIIRRKMMTVDELDQLRKTPNMKIPSVEVLYGMSRHTPTTQGDQTKRVQEAIRNVIYSPESSDYQPNPADRHIEVLIFYSKSKIIWVLNKEHVAYNGPNPYGFIPFCFAPYSPVLGRFYAQSIADVQENNQRYIQALLNNHLDNLALALQPPRIMPRGGNLTPAQLAWTPGAIHQVDSPKDVQIAQQSPSPTVFAEISYIEASAEKRTGISGLSGGAPRPSNANRTMGGMQMQLSGSANRISAVVGHMERYLIVPLLYKLYYLIRHHKQAGDSVPAYNSQHGLYSVGAEAFQKKCKFRMNAASRMVTRDKLIQIFPFLAQYLFQGPLLEKLQAIGQTVDFGVAAEMLQDATNIGRIYHVIRPMNAEEQKAAQTPPPQLQMQMQQKQQELQGRMQMNKEDNQTELQKEQIKKQPDPGVQMAAQMDLEKQKQEMAMEQQSAQQKLFVQAMMDKVKMQGQMQMKQMEMAMKKQEMAVQGQAHQQDMAHNAMSHQMKLQQMYEQMQMQRQQAQQDADEGSGTGLSTSKRPIKAEKTTKKAVAKPKKTTSAQ